VARLPPETSARICMDNPECQCCPHRAHGFCCLRVSKFPEHDHKIFTYSGDNVLQEFFDHIKNEQDVINKILSSNLPMNTLIDEETRAHNAATAALLPTPGLSETV